MTAQMPNVPEVLLSKVQQLLPEKQRQLLVFADFLLYQQSQTQITASQAEALEQPILDAEPHISLQAIPQQRIFGQYQGQIWISGDFDAPLSDEFWLGES